MEAAGLGLFMLSAVAFSVVLEHPASGLHQALPDPRLRRLAMGLAMGGTAAALVYSPWGRRSGAHLNPAFTLTFLRLGKIEPGDALGYVLAQFAGGLAGVAMAAALLGARAAAPSVRFAATLPGASGLPAAFAAEAAISFLLMLAVLHFSNRPGTTRFTGLVCAALIVGYITLEAPVSGMSMNPARSLASALPARAIEALWIYFTAPPLGMLLAAELVLWWRGADCVLCAKVVHDPRQPCIFRCSWPAPDQHTREAA